MRTSPIYVVDPTELPNVDQIRLGVVATEAARTGKIDFNELPEAIRESALFALAAFARGEKVTTIVDGGKPLSSTEAAAALGMSRTHLSRLCEEGRIESFLVGSHLRVSAEEVARILTARGRAITDAREASATAEQRRRDRAAKAAGLD